MICGVNIQKSKKILNIFLVMKRKIISWRNDNCISMKQSKKNKADRNIFFFFHNDRNVFDFLPRLYPQCLQKLMDSEQQIERYGKECELLFIESCNPFGSHISGVYSEGKIALAFIHEIMQ
jgi:hypothetical protein